MKAGTPRGLEAKRYMDYSGELVPDEFIIDLVKERLCESDCENGYLFDAFTRTMPPAEAMKQAGVAIDHVLELDVPFDEIIVRMSGRRCHPASGRTYHVKFTPPKVEGKDDVTDEPLIQRDDDKEETVRKRLQVYVAQTRPLIDYYNEWMQGGAEHGLTAPQYRRVSGLGSAEEIRARILDALA